MKRVLGSAALMLAASAVAASAQPRPQPFVAGEPVGVVVGDVHTPVTDNVRVFGGIVSANSCAYDATRGAIVVPSRGAPQNQAPNDAYVSLINHDGSVNTLRWIGVNRNGRLVLNQPFGIEIVNGTIYVADRDGGLDNPDGGVITPFVSVIRMFDLATGAPTGSIEVADSPGFYDLAVAEDGTIYATQIGPAGAYPPPEDMRIYRITPDGTAEIIATGDPMSSPSGLALDPDGNLVVVNARHDQIFTYSTDGELLATEEGVVTEGLSVMTPGNIGIVILPDGTRYVLNGTSGAITRTPAGGGAGEVIASGIPGGESLCYDPDANQLVVPMGPGNALAFVPLD